MRIHKPGPALTGKMQISSHSPLPSQSLSFTLAAQLKRAFAAIILISRAPLTQRIEIHSKLKTETETEPPKRTQKLRADILYEYLNRIESSVKESKHHSLFLMIRFRLHKEFIECPVPTNSFFAFFPRNGFGSDIRT